MSNAMELSRESLEYIGRYVKEQLPAWLQSIGGEARHDWELRLTERLVRVEEELKAQRELTQQGFGAMERRLELIEKRFDAQSRQIGRWMSLATLLIALTGLMGALGMFAG